MTAARRLEKYFGELATYAENEPQFLEELVAAARLKDTKAVMKLVAVAIPGASDPEVVERIAKEAERRAAQAGSEHIAAAATDVNAMAQGVLWPE